MNFVYITWFFIVGLFFGSFFGVVGSRLSNGESIVKPRSHCSYCKHTLNWYELIPIFSYIIQRGKCKNCGKSISVFYPITELICGLLFSISFFCFGFSKELIMAILISSFLVIVIVSDLNYLIIPDEVTIFFSVVTAILRFVLFGLREGIFSVLSGVLLFCLMYSIMMIGNKIFKKETLGGADIKLMFFIGLILTPPLGIFNIFLASCLALPISIIFLIKDRNHIIPFGPFLLIGLFIIYCFS